MSKEVSQEGHGHQNGKDYVDPPPAPLIDLAEIKLWSFYRALIAEFIATLLFLYITVATIIGYKKSGPCDGIGLLGVAWAIGGMIFVLVYCTAGISGKTPSLPWKDHSFSSPPFWFLRSNLLRGVVFSWYMFKQVGISTLL